MLIATNNNALEVYQVPLKPEKKHSEAPEVRRLYVVDLPGHRSDVRTLSLSSTDELLASGSNGILHASP